MSRLRKRNLPMTSGLSAGGSSGSAAADERDDFKAVAVDQQLLGMMRRGATSPLISTATRWRS